MTFLMGCDLKANLRFRFSKNAFIFEILTIEFIY